MKDRILLLTLLSIAMLLAACSQAGDESAEAAAEDEAVITTGQTAAESNDSSGDLPMMTTDATVTVNDVARADEIDLLPVAAVPSDELSLDLGDLPYEATVLAVDSSPYRQDQMTGPSGLPEHWRIEFAPADDGEVAGTTPVLYVIPLEAYKALWAEAGDLGVEGTLTALIMTIEDGARPFQEAGVPGLPVEQVGTAFNDLAAQGDYLALDNATGLRFVGRFSPGLAAVSNDRLSYVFLGFSNDGRYLVSFFYPIRTDALPDDPVAASEAVASLLVEDPFGYMSGQATLLNRLDDGDFSPRISALDALVASLRFDAGDEIALSSESAPVEEAAGAATMIGTRWQWTSLEQTEATTTVPDPARYSVQFGHDGRVTVSAGCQEGSGAYETGTEGSLSVTLDNMFPPRCEPDYLEAVLLGGLGNAANYDLGDGRLTITLQNENGVMLFVPASP